MIEEPVLALSDHTKAYEVHKDASDFSQGGVLMQEGYPIAYELNGPEERDDSRGSLLAYLEALPIWVQICGKDRQCGDKLLPNLEEARPKAS